MLSEHVRLGTTSLASYCTEWGLSLTTLNLRHMLIAGIRIAKRPNQARLQSGGTPMAESRPSARSSLQLSRPVWPPYHAF